MKPMRVMRFLQNIFVVSFSCPFLLGRPGARGSCSRGQGTLCWGRPLGGADKAEFRRPVRAQGFDPEPSPTDRAETGTTSVAGIAQPLKDHAIAHDRNASGSRSEV